MVVSDRGRAGFITSDGTVDRCPESTAEGFIP